MDCFYVYYRVDAGQRDAAKAAVAYILDQVLARCAVRGRLMLRADDPMTWMEVYEDADDAETFRRELDQIVASSGLLAMLSDAAKRHVEHFRSAAP